MNGVVFQTSTATSAHSAVSGLATTDWPTFNKPRCRPQELTMPRLSWYIQFHICALTTVGMAHGTRMAVRKRPRPLILLLITSAKPRPSRVSTLTEVIVSRAVFHTELHQAGSASSPTLTPSSVTFQ